MKSLLRQSVTATAFVAALTLLSACSTSGPDNAAGGGEAKDFYAGFVAPKAPAEEGLDQMVDTSQYKKKAGAELVIAYADASLNNSFRVMAKGDTEYGISLLPNARLVYTNANDSVPKQIADVDDLITQKVDAIILAAVDVKALCPSIQKAKNAGIPVIIQERRVECDGYTTFASLNTNEVALYQMEYIAQRLGGKGKIAIVSGIPGVGNTVSMEEGYKSVLSKYPDIKVVATEYAEYDPTKAREVTAALLTAHPDLDAIASISGNITTGVFRAVQEAGKLDQMKAWTGDDANGWMKVQADNNLPSMTVPYPISVGRETVRLAGKILVGEEVPRTTEVARWAAPEDFSKNITKYANADRPDEWWYTDTPCQFDPFCKTK